MSGVIVLALINCPNCGKEISEETRFCKYCGKPVEQIIKPQEKPVQKNKKSKKGIIIAIIAVVLVVALVLVGIFVIKPKLDDKDNKEKESATAQISNVDEQTKGEDNTKDENKPESVAEYKLIKQKVYDETGAVRFSVDYEYDTNGNMIKSTNYDLAEGGINGWVEISYDANGNEIKGAAYSVVDGSTYISQEFNYDAEGNLVKEVRYSSDGSIEVVVEYTYDANGNKIKTTEPQDYWIEYSYDANGRLIKEEEYEFGYAECCSSVEYTYDANGNLKKRTEYYEGSVDGWTEYSYDANGKLIKGTDFNLYEDGVTVEESSVIYEYDSNGNVIKQSAIEDGYTLSRIEYEYAVK